VEKKSLLGNTFLNRCSQQFSNSNHNGQAAVEFTLTFVLLLIIAWIPADFGLAFFTGQQAQNAAREGARIASADPTLVAQMGGATSMSCTAPCFGSGSVLQATAGRLSKVLIKNAQITLSYDPSVSGCHKMLTVQITGTYNYFFYQLLRLVGVSGVKNSENINRVTTMRYEHQTPCSPF
jgi:Flp pilus assembly protein TadG